MIFAVSRCGSDPRLWLLLGLVFWPAAVACAQEVAKKPEAEIALHIDRGASDWGTIGTPEADLDLIPDESAPVAPEWRTWTLPPLVGQSGISQPDEARDPDSDFRFQETPAIVTFEADTSPLRETKAAARGPWHWLPHTVSAQAIALLNFQERTLTVSTFDGQETYDFNPYVGGGLAMSVAGGGPVLFGDAYDWELRGMAQVNTQTNDVLSGLPNNQLESQIALVSLESNCITSQPSSDGTSFLFGLRALTFQEYLESKRTDLSSSSEDSLNADNTLFGAQVGLVQSIPAERWQSELRIQVGAYANQRRWQVTDGVSRIHFGSTFEDEEVAFSTVSEMRWEARRVFPGWGRFDIGIAGMYLTNVLTLANESNADQEGNLNLFSLTGAWSRTF